MTAPTAEHRTLVSQPPGPAALVNVPDLTVESLAVFAEYEEARAAYSAAEDAFAAKLDDELRQELLNLLDLHWRYSDRGYELHMTDLRRHFPALAPALSVVWDH